MTKEHTDDPVPDEVSATLDWVERTQLIEWVERIGQSIAIRATVEHSKSFCEVISRQAREINSLRAEVAAESELCDRLAAELARWGWGDMHYGETPQERGPADLVAEHAARRGADVCTIPAADTPTA